MDKTIALLTYIANSNDDVRTFLNKYKNNEIDQDTMICSCITSISEKKSTENEDQINLDMITW